MNTMHVQTSKPERYNPWFLKNYLITTVIKEDSKGGVFIAQDYNKDWFGKNSVIVKQGKGNAEPDEFGRTTKDNFKWQIYLYDTLHKLLDLPRIKEFIRYKHNFYLIIEYIKGVTLREKLSTIFDHGSWKNLGADQRNSILKLLLEVTDQIGLMHEAGFVHRDITPENFLIDKRDNVFMLDLELTYNVREVPPSPPYAIGTPGYMSPEQRLRRIPTVKEDIFGLGALLLFAFTNFPPLKFDIENPESLEQPLNFFGVPAPIGVIIRQCLSQDKSMRPELMEIRAAIDEQHYITS